MNRKNMALLGIVALGLGGASTIAYQTHAQSTTTAVAATVSVPATVATPDVKTAADTDNIQDDKGGVDKPDAAVSEAADTETNDDAKDVVSGTKDTQDQNDSATGINDAEIAD
jgi:hypothetical protein